MDLTAAWTLLTSLSLIKKPIIYTDQPMQGVRADRHLPVVFADSKGRWWRRTQLSSDGSYHLVLVRTVSFPFSFQPPQTLHSPAFLPCCLLPSLQSSSSSSSSSSKFPSLFPCCTGTHSRPCLTSARGNSTVLLFGDQISTERFLWL